MRIGTVFATGFLVLAGAGWFGLPLWQEARNAQETAEWIVAEAESQGGEAKVIRSVRYPENPFTWFNAKPSHVVARQTFQSGYIVLSARLQESGVLDVVELFVGANCPLHKFRLVDQAIYEGFLEESGYDVLGHRLPSWSEADPYDLVAVSLHQEWQRGRDNHLAFAVACRWEDLGVN